MTPYEQTQQTLLEALRKGHDHQIDMLATMERAYDFLEDNGELLSDEQVLTLRILLKQGETMAGRYFGM